MPAPSQNSAHGCALRKRLTERERDTHTHTYTPSFSLSVSLSLSMRVYIYISYILHIVSIKFHKYIFDVNVCSILTCLRIPHAPCRSGDRALTVTAPEAAPSATGHLAQWFIERRGHEEREPAKKGTNCAKGRAWGQSLKWGFKLATAVTTNWELASRFCYKRESGDSSYLF